MPVEQQVALWFIATVLPFCINGLSGQRPDALGISGMLIVGWAFERVCWAVWSPPEAVQLYAPIDLAFGVTCLVAWWSRRAWWKLLLAADFIVQCCLYVVYWNEPSQAHFHPYVLINNVLFALELCLAAFPGIGHAMAILARYRMPDHPRLRPHGGP